MRLSWKPAATAVIAIVALGSAGAVAAQRSDGQLTPAATNPESAFTASLTAANEVPATTETGTGTASIIINSSTGQVCVNLTTNLSEAMTGFHIHPGAAGATGSVLVNFAVTSGTSVAKCVNTSPATAASIVADPTNFYVNAHTATFPDGAIRGQLAPRGNAAGALQLLPEPLRAYDSRIAPATKLGASETRTIDLTSGRSGDGTTTAAVPAGARAAVVTLTVTQTVDVGFLTIYSNALSAAPATSNINWSATDSDAAVTVTVLVDGSGKVKVTSGPRGTQFIVDVVGYYL